MMKRIQSAILIAAALVLASCGGPRLTKEEVIDYGEIGLSDIVSYIVAGYQCNWEDMDPAEEMKLSSVYAYSSPYCGFAQKDINGDDIPELLIGDRFEDGTTVIYDIYTIHPKTASLIHLASGGERDRFTINESGTIIEEGSNSADDSFTKAYRIKNGKLVELKASTLENCPMDLEMQTFESIAHKGEPKVTAKNFVTKELPKEYNISKNDQITLLGKTLDYFRGREEFDVDVFTGEVFEDKEVAETFNRYKEQYEAKNDIEIEDHFGISAPACERQQRVYKRVIKLDNNVRIYITGSRDQVVQGEDEYSKFYKVYYEEESI